MSRALRRLLLLILLLLVSVWGILSICFMCTLQDKEMEAISILKNIEDDEAHPLRIKPIPIESASNDDDTQVQRTYPLVIRFLDSEIISNDINIEDTGVYPLGIRYIPQSILKKQETDLNGSHEDELERIKELKEKLQGDTLSSGIKFEDDFLRLYISDIHNQNDRAVEKIQNFVNLEINHSYFFRNIDFDFSQNPAYRFVTLLPYRGKDGSVTILFEAAKWDPNEVPFENFKQVMFMIYVQELRNPLTQITGFNFICDFADVGFRYLKFCTPQNIFLLNYVLHDVLPAIFVGIHLINVNFIGNLLVTLSRPFLPAHIEKILYMHSSVEALLDYYSVTMLPVQYGGTLSDYYMDDWIRKANEAHANFSVRGQKNIYLL